MIWLQAVCLFTSLFLGMAILFLTYHAATRRHPTPLMVRMCLAVALAGFAILLMLPTAWLAVFPNPPLSITDSTGEIIHDLQGTPNELTTGLALVTNTQTLTTFFRNAADENSIGTYSQMDRTIYLKPGYGTTDTWWHELGHHIYYYRLTDAQRDDWGHIHAAGGEPTDYAYTSAAEDFAESYSIAAFNISAVDSPRQSFLRAVAAQTHVLQYGLFGGQTTTPSPDEHSPSSYPHAIG